MLSIGIIAFKTQYLSLFDVDIESLVQYFIILYMKIMPMTHTNRSSMDKTTLISIKIINIMENIGSVILFLLFKVI